MAFVYTQAPIISSQPPTVISPRPWTHDICDCFGDCGECCFAYFCTCTYMYNLTSRINESCCAIYFGGLVPIRTKIRTERKIQGSICGDFCIVFWCPFCALLQMSKEARDTRPII